MNDNEKISGAIKKLTAQVHPFQVIGILESILRFDLDADKKKEVVKRLEGLVR